MKIKLKSFSLADVVYTVDKDEGRCTCTGFAKTGWCQHLDAVGRYKVNRVTLSSRPSFSQALSGVVKCIRLRNVGEAAYWLNYCWGFRTRLSGSQFRTVRRLLIGAAEDGHSIAVMEKMADAFVSLLSKDAKLEDVLAELIRICKVPNWWHPETGGPAYIYRSLLAVRQTLYDQVRYSTLECLSALEKAIEQSDQAASLFWTLKAHDSHAKAGQFIGEKLLRIAQGQNHVPAMRLMRNIYLRHAKSLTHDTNFTSQAAWLLAGGVSPVIDHIENVSREEASRLLHEVLTTPPHVIPSWCCDGIHCAGNDVRYAGMCDRMWAVCKQYEHYGRVDPNDVWLEEQFYVLDGLRIEADSASQLAFNEQKELGGCGVQRLAQLENGLDAGRILSEFDQ